MEGPPGYYGSPGSRGARIVTAFNVYFSFYPRDAVHSAVFAVVRCPSVCHTAVLCLNG